MPTMKIDSRPSRTADKFVIRFPDGLRGPLEDVAERNHRSTNSEIVVRLLESLEREIQEEEHPVRIDSPELSLAEQEMLQRFRALPWIRQSALISLVVSDSHSKG
jgi:hypothetical protein